MTPALRIEHMVSMYNRKPTGLYPVNAYNISHLKKKEEKKGQVLIFIHSQGNNIS